MYVKSVMSSYHLTLCRPLFSCKLINTSENVCSVLIPEPEGPILLAKNRDSETLVLPLLWVVLPYSKCFPTFKLWVLPRVFNQVGKRLGKTGGQITSTHSKQMSLIITFYIWSILMKVKEESEKLAWYSHSRRWFDRFSLTYHEVQPLCSMLFTPMSWKQVRTIIYTWMFIAALFTVAQVWDVLVKQCSKLSKPGFSNTWTMNFQVFQLVLEKERSQRSNCQHLYKYSWPSASLGSISIDSTN